MQLDKLIDDLKEFKKPDYLVKEFYEEYCNLNNREYDGGFEKLVDYSAVEVIRENKIITTEEKGKKTYSVVNNGVVVIKPNSYDLIKYIYLIEKNSDYFLVEKNNKFGVINKQNEILIPIQFSSLQNMNYSVQFEDGILFIGQRNNKKVIIDLCKNEYIIK